MKLSACWITKNEEKNLPRSIESVKDIVEKIIVVDTGSTDSTIEIARSYGAEVYNFEWIGDFAAARNYALSKVSGDFIIFLDADEYFEPKLTQEMLPIIERGFSRGKDGLYIIREDIDEDTGRLKSTGHNVRIFRNEERLRYQGKIHEELTNNGAYVSIEQMDDFIIKHTGYTTSIFDGKKTRNIELMEAALEKETNPTTSFHYRLYLVREYTTVDPEKSFEYCQSVLAQSDKWDYYCSAYNKDAVPQILIAISATSRYREKVSRQFIYKKLIQMFQRNIPGYILTPLMDCLYMVFFDNKELAFIESFNANIKNALSLQTYEFQDHTDYLDVLYSNAALVEWKRGNLDKALDYAVKGLDEKRTVCINNISNIRIIFDCIKDREPIDILQYFLSLIDGNDPQKMHLFTMSLMLEEAKDYYFYFLKKRVEAGVAETDEKLMYLNCFQGLKSSIDEVQRMVVESPEKLTVDALRSHLFISAIWFDNGNIYMSNAQTLTPYLRILNAYFGGSQIEAINDMESSMIKEAYSILMFVAGREKAEKFRKVAQNDPRTFFIARAKYEYANRNYDNILEMDRSILSPANWDCYYYISAAQIFTGRYDEALENIERALKSNLEISLDMINTLGMLIARSSGEVKEKAQKVYDTYAAIYDENVDLNDVINTGIIMNQQEKKYRKAMKALTAKDLLDRIEKEKEAPMKTELLETLEKVAVVYEKDKLDSMAADCYVRMIAHGYKVEENVKKLVEIYEKIGNEAAANAIAGMDLTLTAGA